MSSGEFDFANAAGQTLSGVLEAPGAKPKAWAVFAHCFTCDKSSLAATRVSRGLAAEGIGVLRFDFTGLGESQGAFGQGLSSDARDIVSAAMAMQERDMAPGLLVGHSLGGAAALSAATDLPSVRAVAVIGAPFEASHVLTHLRDAVDDIERERTRVSIAGRPFELGPDFVADLRSQDQAARIADLDRALLVLHSPLDEVVPISEAASIFQAARHPKSFVSLDTADHLLTKREDAEYAAAVIAAWAARYLDAPDPQR